MNATPPPLASPDSTGLERLARALRFATCALVLGASFLNILSAYAVPKFGAIFNDMLAGKPLPALTEFILAAHPFLLALSILIPLCALSVLFVRHLTLPIYLLGGLALLALFQLFVTNLAMLWPLSEVIVGMSNPGP